MRRPRRPRRPSGTHVAGLLLAGALSVAACAAPGERSEATTPDDTASADTSTTPPTADAATPTATPTAPTSADTGRTALLARADSVVAAIARRDWAAIAALAHPERGVRFAPYGHVEPAGECTVTLMPRALAALATDSTTRCWGHFDGTGEPIRMDFAAYYARFVHDRAYEDARRGEPDERLGQGNTLSNLSDAFGPGATFVEYHVPGTEQYGGMDWGSLRLVFAPAGGQWRLVGIVHDQWTI